MNQSPDLQQRQPLGAGPGAGEVIAVTPHVLWFRILSPGAPLGGVNVWALRDGQGWALVDTGFADAESAAQWDGILDQLDGPITRIICTHFHPDHIGQVGNLLRRFDVPLMMTEVEWSHAQKLANPPLADAGLYAAHLHRTGLSPDVIEQMTSRPRGGMTTGLPESCMIMRAGDTIEMGETTWTVSIGAGHSPAPAIFENRRDKLMIAGDQLLMRITPHVGTQISDMDGDPLGDYLHYLAHAEAIDPDMLVLPGHGPAFRFAGIRAHEIALHHEGKLNALVGSLAQNRLVSDTIDVLFGRPLKGVGLLLGIAEAEAHLQHLVKTGRASRTTDHLGRYLYSALS